MKRRSSLSKSQPGPSPAAQAGSRSLAKGLELVERIVGAGRPMPLKDLAQEIGLGKASTLRLLRTLVDAGYIARDDSERYVPRREWPSAERQDTLHRLQAAARPHLEQLNAVYGETVALAFLFDDVIRVVDVVESRHPIRMSNHRGRILQPYASSLGKAIAAFQPADRVPVLLHTYGVFPLTPQTRTEFRRILEDLKEVRDCGCAWDRGETVPGGQCLGAPVRDSSGAVVAAISISMPRERFDDELEQTLPAVLRKSAAAISEALAAGGG
jgi:IclR family transcriptional regulator, acetate operon repressor